MEMGDGIGGFEDATETDFRVSIVMNCPANDVLSIAGIHCDRGWSHSIYLLLSVIIYCCCGRCVMDQQRGSHMLQSQCNIS